jgi:hypothetical protein
MDRSHWTVNEDGTARCNGVNYDNAQPITVWTETMKNGEHFIVFKVPGGKHWVGRGMDHASHSGHYEVCRVLEKRGSSYSVMNLFEMPLSKPKDKS